MRLSAAPTATAKSIQTAPYRLAKADADAAHAVPWDDAACERFVARVAMFMLRGFNATDADDLAERLHLRDVDGDDRSSCIECRYLLPGPRCACEALGRQRVGRDDLAMLRRCPGFVARDREPAC